jgi:hypothetical protein
LQEGLNILWWIPTGSTIVPKKPKQNQSPKRQIENFRKAAHELGCDENEKQFQDVLRTIAKNKPKRQPTKAR